MFGEHHKKPDLQPPGIRLRKPSRNELRQLLNHSPDRRAKPVKRAPSGETTDSCPVPAKPPPLQAQSRSGEWGWDLATPSHGVDKKTTERVRSALDPAGPQRVLSGARSKPCALAKTVPVKQTLA
eukprot:CAMPEP_0204261806 /NCGR_PEP_ID=MMETSP0468-20130131/7250_1 /ASSEMBLY_ACC=CAM_ASM_000383 /TAXON_ID=2969 /ORGANISM="Oxyrrhis marina" /LENGTH=124 /DNA_ID=CAMNT_0051236403 /DNA_START=28 /DNA_END=401 /DNA_ORIENTATION=-